MRSLRSPDRLLRSRPQPKALSGIDIHDVSLMRLLFVSWGLCFALMAAIDYYLGSAAEYLNAWSVIERALGRNVSATDSAAYSMFGGFGEAVCVLLVTFSIAALITLLVRQLSSWF